MALPAHFIINIVNKPECLQLFPWVTTPGNSFKMEDHLRPCIVPDRTAGSYLNAPGAGPMSFELGDFVEGFSQPEDEGTWDAVVTCFFIDTANDVLEYLRTIHHVLPLGGVWVNLGPLLWHHDEASKRPCPQLSMEEIITAAEGLGMRVQEQTVVECDFGSNAPSMLQTRCR